MKCNWKSTLKSLASTNIKSSFLILIGYFCAKLNPIIMQKLLSQSLLYLILFSFIGLQAQNISVEQLIENRVQPQEEDAVVVDGIELYAQSELPRFYSNRGFEPAWNDLKNRTDLLESLESSVDEGLMPEDYHLERIQAIVKKTESRELTREEKADLDILMTDA